MQYDYSNGHGVGDESADGPSFGHPIVLTAYAARNGRFMLWERIGDAAGRVTTYRRPDADEVQARFRGRGELLGIPLDSLGFLSAQGDKTKFVGQLTLEYYADAHGAPFGSVSGVVVGYDVHAAGVTQLRVLGSLQVAAPSPLPEGFDLVLAEVELDHLRTFSARLFRMSSLDGGASSAHTGSKS